ncbi:hypothetical protein ULF88_12035 [Halopseudomonas pachastrellae]|nr:hypothetical protein [Halopseudomonas pachastrellae]
MMVELVSPDHREVRNKTFIREWQKRIQAPPGIDRINITEQQSGPPGKDVDIRLTGSDPQQLKDAADALSVILSGIEGVVSTDDDMTWGREQLVYSLTPYGQALGSASRASATSCARPTTAGWRRSIRTSATRSKYACSCRAPSAKAWPAWVT